MILMVILYIIVEYCCINAFFTQRAVLDLQRKHFIPYDFRPVICPQSKCYKFYRVFQILSWIILIYIAYQYKWYYALMILVVGYLISLIITSRAPVPASKYSWAKKAINEQLISINASENFLIK